MASRARAPSSLLATQNCAASAEKPVWGTQEMQCPPPTCGFCTNSTVLLPQLLIGQAASLAHGMIVQPAAKPGCCARQLDSHIGTGTDSIIFLWAISASAVGSTSCTGQGMRPLTDDALCNTPNLSCLESSPHASGQVSCAGCAPDRRRPGCCTAGKLVCQLTIQLRTASAASGGTGQHRTLSQQPMVVLVEQAAHGTCGSRSLCPTLGHRPLAS